MVVHDHDRQWYDFKELGCGFTLNGNYTVKGWELFIAPDQYYNGNTIVDFIDLLNLLKDKYNLKSYSNNKIDRIVIYTDNMLKIKGFFSKYITDNFGELSITLLDYFNFRPINRWSEVYNAKDIAITAKTMIDTIFLPQKFFFLTPNQVPRKCIKRACKSSLAFDIFPSSYFEYKMFRKALFGGIVYLPYKDLVITDPLMCLDLKSAYIYDLIIEKHCSTSFISENTDNWEFFLESKSKTSIGSYTIKYSCISNKIKSFKDSKGVQLEKGENIATVIFTAVDLKTFIETANVFEVKCNWLYSCELDYLPKYIVDEIINQYNKKLSLENDETAYNLQKSVVNGIFGDCIRIYENEHEYENARKNASVAPQWGIFCTSYAKKNLLKLANKVEGWVYSDTDSIYCFDNDYNRKLLEEYNKEVRNNILEFCNKFGYDYDKLKNLGTFKIESRIKKFKAIAQKVYMYTTVDGKFHLKAAGIDQSTIKVDDSLYDKKTIPCGSKTYRHVEDGIYYEDSKKGLENLIATTILASKQKKQY